jgi:hypothetical protein
VSELQDLKERTPRNSTEAGRQIDWSDKQPESALASIRISPDPDSNVNDESELHDEKQSASSNSTQAGRQNDFNDEK